MGGNGLTDIPSTPSTPTQQWPDGGPVRTSGPAGPPGAPFPPPPRPPGVPGVPVPPPPGPRHLAHPPGGGGRPGWWRLLPSRRIALTIGGLGLVMALLVLLAPTSLFDPLVRRAVSRYGGSCTELVGVEVDSGSWPVVARALAGRYRDVSMHVEEMRADGFSYHDVTFSAAEVDVAPLGGLLSERDVQVRGGTASATVRFADIERVIAASGTTVHLRADGPTLVADVEVPLLGPVPTTVTITPVDGDMELVFAPLDVFTLPPVRVPVPAPLSLREVEVGSDALRFDSTVDGAVRSDELGCDVGS